MNIEIPVEYEFLKNSKGVIHVGANTGQEAEIYNSFDVNVLWIEPLDEEFGILCDNIAKYHPKQRAIKALISKTEDEEVLFKVTNNSWSSSILELADHKKIHPEVTELVRVKKLTTKLSTLFTRFSVDLLQYDTLILDVQGAELLVLEGLGEYLRHFKYVRCEAADFNIYDGCCQLKDLDQFFKLRGFKQLNLFKNITSGNEQVGFEYEALYEKVAEPLQVLTPVVITDPQTGTKGLFKVAAVTTTPRLGFQAHFGVLHAAFADPKLFILRIGGAFWEQGIQNGINILDKLGADYVITIDYDGIFSNEDVKELLNLVVRHPEADVIVSWQIGRGNGNNNLVTMLDKNGERIKVAPLDLFQDDVTKIDMGAFGLTIIKVAALKKMPKPWFLNIPNADGEWERGKTDADSYFFKKAKEFDLVVYVANRVHIGHLEEVIIWPNNELQPVYQDVRDYALKGRPF
jgi:FkbM family methyltransferase